MAVAKDQVTLNSTTSFTHTPVGTPRGVAVLVVMANAADVVTGVTYGGSAMSETASSPLVSTSGEGGTCYGYFLGSSVPSGAQTVAVSVSAGTPRIICQTVTAAADTEIITVGTFDRAGVTGDQTATLSTSGRTSVVLEVIWSGAGATTGVNPLTGWTNPGGGGETDEGSETNYRYTYDTVGTSDVTYGGTMTASDHITCYAVAIGEVAGGSTYTLDADAASYTYTPTDADLQQGYLIDAGVAAYAYTVTDADLLHGYVLDADAVSFTYAVTDVSLDYTPAGSTYTLDADAADFAVTVTDADLIYTQLNHYVLDAEAVSFSVAANDVDLQYSGQAATTPAPPPGGGKGMKHRRRILLADGRILIPTNDQEYRRAVEQIIADFEKPEPAKQPAKRRAEAKKVAPPKKPTPVKRLPKEFHKAVDNHTTGVLNYLAIQSAWKAYEAQQDEEAVEMLLMVS